MNGYNTAIIEGIMLDFADSTGLAASGNPPRRYLWTDAFAVCNFLGLCNFTGNEKYRDLALHLVDQVHNTLGRHRADDLREGWISGLDDEEGRVHPTAGGLRIGKKMNERGPSEPFDEHLEWDRDGQYYHYLTKWMHALNCVSVETGDPAYNTWAIELAKTAHGSFTYAPPFRGPKRMYWKMSIDLTRPLVSSMGHHDPLDGLITYQELQMTALKYSQTGPDLISEIADMAGICKGKSWDTDDPLGLGELLCSAYKAAALLVNSGSGKPDLVETLLEASLIGLRAYGKTGQLDYPASRLAFREFGLSIGLKAAERLKGLASRHRELFRENERLHERIATLMKYLPMAEQIEKFWLNDTHMESATWTDHRDINMVMLATSLAPDEYLAL